MNVKLTIGFFFMLCFINSSFDVVAQMRYVDVASGQDNATCGTTGSPCKTIQYTVDNIALNGDIVYLKSGVYSLPSGANPDFGVVELPANKSLHFVGDSSGGAIIDGLNTRRGFHYEQSTACPLSGGANNIIETRRFSFDNLSIINCYYSARLCGVIYYAEGGGIGITSDPQDSLFVRITNCTFSENRIEDLTNFNTTSRTASGAGVFIEGRNSTYTNVFIDACSFNNNKATQSDNGGRGGAIALRRVSEAKILNSSFCGNRVEGLNANNGDLAFQRNAGSAVHIYDDNNLGASHTFEINRCSFVNNTSTTTNGSTFTYQSVGAVCMSRADQLNATSNAILRLGNSQFYNNWNEIGISHIGNNGGTLDSVSIGNNIFKSAITDFLGADTTLCIGLTINLGENLPFGKYLWNDGSTDSILVVNVSIPDTFWVEVDIAGCVFRDSLIVDTVSAPPFSLGIDTSFCPPFNYVLDPGPGFVAYLWQDGSTASSYVATNTGTYSVELTTLSGCVVRDTLIISDSLSIDLGADTALCSPFNYVISPGSFVSYQWQDGSLASSFQATSPGIYSVTVSTSSGCAASDTLVISELLSIDLGADTSICSSFNYVLSPGRGFASYVWQNGSTDSVFTVTGAGVYWVNVTTISGCVATDTIVISNSLSIDLGVDTTFCSRFTLLISPGNNFASYLWQDGSTRPEFIVTQPGEYSVVVTTIDGCIASDTLTVSTSSDLLDLGKDTAFCSTMMNYALDPGLNFNSYRWQDGSSSPLFYVTEPGIYYLDITTDSGCFASDTIKVLLDTFSVNIGPDQIFCSQFNYGLSVGAGFSSYLWQDGSTNSFFNVTTPGTYFVELTNKSGCIARDTAVIETDIFTIDLGRDTNLCVKQKVDYEIGPGSGFASYVWQDGSTTKSYSVKESGSYSVFVTKASGCAATDTIEVAINLVPFDLGEDTVLCADTSLLLELNLPNSVYLWQDDSNSSRYVVSETGTYWVEVQTSGCALRDTLKVIFPELILPTNKRDTICSGEVLTLDVTEPNCSYLWQDGSTDSQFLATGTGVYSAFVTNECATVERVFVLESNGCDCIVFFPNAFSPNGDQLNDFFTPVSNCNFSEYELMVFNRWGEKVFESNLPLEGWDGKQNGELVEQGVYVYTLLYKAEKATYRENFKGKIMLTK